MAAAAAGRQPCGADAAWHKRSRACMQSIGKGKADAWRPPSWGPGACKNQGGFQGQTKQDIRLGLRDGLLAAGDLAALRLRDLDTGDLLQKRRLQNAGITSWSPDHSNKGPTSGKQGAAKELLAGPYRTGEREVSDIFLQALTMTAKACTRGQLPGATVQGDAP